VKVNGLTEKCYEVTTDLGEILGWLDVESVPADDGTETVMQRYMAKPAGRGRVKPARTMGEAAAYVAGMHN
jgi:hypothetical protein